MEKSAENCKISQKFGISSQMMDKTRAQKWENLHCQKEILIGFYIFFNFMKKSSLVLKLCHFKVQCLDFPMKIVR